MNTLVIVVIAACCLAAGYLLYGRWLAHKWGIDPNAKTPAVTKEDGQDYVPTDGWVVFAHQFSSIAGAGPVTGAIQAAVFGWVPVFLWIILGGIFFGAVTDFGALYASVKNEGKSMGLLIEQYIGKTGKKLFLLFCWLFTLIVTAAFADMVAGTFNAYETVDGVTSLSAAATVDGDTGLLVQTSGGELYDTEILGVEKGSFGKPGVMSGVIYYGNQSRLGSVEANTDQGIFGTANPRFLSRVKNPAIPIGYRQDVKKGRACIRSSVSGELKDYEIEIQKIDHSSNRHNKDMVIRVTDPELLSLTGGIVQGMSGSPIIQNGKLIGAVTHVFIQDSTRGYGILVENMLGH